MVIPGNVEALIEEDEMSKKTVLIADDEPAVRKLVSRMLDRDYDVIEAQNGTEAINMAYIYRPDIIFMDIMMPMVDGLSACYALKADETTRIIPVVMLTAVTHELNKKLSEDILGADGYITKPFTRESLLEEMNRLMLSAGDNAQPAPHEETAVEKALDV
jgi:two-component system, cell cycle response regulator